MAMKAEMERMKDYSPVSESEEDKGNPEEEQKEKKGRRRRRRRRRRRKSRLRVNCREYMAGSKQCWSREPQQEKEKLPTMLWFIKSFASCAEKVQDVQFRSCRT
jgi:hypothetical protein